MDLSIVIPAFEESRKIGADIGAASMFLDSNHLSGEIIVVDDGSGDNTAEVAKNAGAPLPQAISVKVIRYECHRGKGYAVRAGMKETSGKFVMFADSGCCVPYANAMGGLGLLQSGVCDIAHGSRKLAASRIQRLQSPYRRVCARIFRWFINKTMKVPYELTDTQCGFKIYRGDIARELYGECTTDGFMFDVEIIVLAQQRGYRIKEFPIEWTCDRDSRLSPAKSLLRVLSELISIRRKLTKKSGG